MRQPTPWEAVFFIFIFCFLFPTLTFWAGYTIGRLWPRKIVMNDLDKKVKDSMDHMHKTFEISKAWSEEQIEKARSMRP